MHQRANLGKPIAALRHRAGRQRAKHAPLYLLDATKTDPALVDGRWQAPPVRMKHQRQVGMLKVGAVLFDQAIVRRFDWDGQQPRARLCGPVCVVGEPAAASRPNPGQQTVLRAADQAALVWASLRAHCRNVP